MHLADRLTLPDAYRARPYRGPADHPAMAAVLTEYRLATGSPEMVTTSQMDQVYAHLEDCDPELDIAVIEHDDDVVAYTRPTYAELVDETMQLVVFAPTRPDHLAEALFHGIAEAAETHLMKWVVAGRPAKFGSFAHHPGPEQRPTGEAAWLEQRGYVATEWSASLRRPDLDDIPDLPIPDGIEVRPATPDQLREIMVAHCECFRGEWGFCEPTESDYSAVIDDPYRDETLWQVAWDGDVVVSQVKPFINHDENAARGYLRGYAEYISTHHDYRNRGIAGALLARALSALADRGMTEAVLGVDTNNPGGAFQLYTKLGFQLESYEVFYTRPVMA